MTLLMPDRSLWIDIETTGLEPEKDRILEIGLVVADEALQPIVARSVVLEFDEAHEPLLDEDVEEMHIRNGLLADCAARGVTQHGADLYIDAFLAEHLPDADWLLAGGSGIDRFDLPFLRAAKYEFADRIHFRTYDLSGAKALLQCSGVDWEPLTQRREHEGAFTEFLLGAPDVPHRGVADALDALFLARNLARLLWQGSH